MEALRSSLRLGGGVDSEGNRQQQSQISNMANRALPAPQALPCALEPETTMKNKLISAWNTVKYGKNGWTSAGEMFSRFCGFLV